MSLPAVLVPVERSVASARAVIRARLTERVATLPAGVQPPSLEGSLFRPLVAYAGVHGHRRVETDGRFWYGALAVQMVHEASLIHDDLIDGAPFRRGRPTVAARYGTAGAVVTGDHLLTSAYRCAALTESLAFLNRFVEAVERTVHGERRQCASLNKSPELASALEVAALKTGELFGVSLATHDLISDPAAAECSGELGRRIGRFYQMVDDFLDYCPGSIRGKPVLQDYRRRTGTWILAATGLDPFDMPEDEVADYLFDNRGRGGPRMRRALAFLEREARRLTTESAAFRGDGGLAGSLIGSWLSDAVSAYHRERAMNRPREGSSNASLTATTGDAE